MSLPRSLLVFAALLLAGCGSVAVGTNDAAANFSGDIDRDTTDEFDVQIEQPSSAPIMPQATRYDVKYVITIANRTDAPVKVKRVDLQSVGSTSASELPPSFRKYDKTIAPHAKEKIDFWATVNLAGGQMAMLPVMLRATIEFESKDSTRKEVFVRNMGGRGSVTVGGSR